jgi:uncharacterized SAM-binding protein YcdF (DUF218 family)
LKALDLNSLITFLGIESWKPMLTALLLPPVPLLLLLLIGARLMLPRRGLGWLVILTSVALLWLSNCTGVAQGLSLFVLHPPAALTSDRIAELKTQNKPPTAIVVLGGGIEPYAPEYNVGNLRYRSLERLRYGIWLSRETGLPVGFSGGVGWGQPDGTPEARIASHIAASEFGRPLKWVEENSRDTRENAALSVALLRKSGIKHIVLVTHGWHMPRAIKAFEAAAGDDMRIEAAPMGLAQRVERPALMWVPSGEGASDVRAILRELLGRSVGA